MLVVSLLLVRVSEPSKNAPRLEMSKNPPKFDLTRLPKFEVPRPADWARAMLHTLETIQPHRPARRHWSDSIRLPMLIISVSALIARLTKPKEASGDWLLRWACRIIYACTVINPFFSVLADDYTFIHDAASSYVIERKRKRSSFTVNQEEAFRRTLIGFGKIRPRRLFALGATLRGIQLHSPLVRIWDPPCQFGTGLNMLALFDGIAWPAVFTLGWAISEKWWQIGRGAVVGASHPRGARGRTTGSAAHDGAVSTSTTATAAANTTAAAAAATAAATAAVGARMSAVLSAGGPKALHLGTHLADDLARRRRLLLEARRLGTQLRILRLEGRRRTESRPRARAASHAASRHTAARAADHGGEGHARDGDGRGQRVVIKVLLTTLVY